MCIADNTICPNCLNTRWVSYDENHATGCSTCCQHPPEKRYVQSERHPHPGAETCGHCGKEFGGPYDAKGKKGCV